MLRFRVTASPSLCISCTNAIFGGVIMFQLCPCTKLRSPQSLFFFIVKHLQKLTLSRGIFPYVWVIPKVMPCWAWVAPLIWCFIPSWLLSPKSWNFINKDMKCWDSGLNARVSRIFIATIHIAAVDRRTQITPNLVLIWVSVHLEAQCKFFTVFWNLILYMTKQGAIFSWPYGYTVTLLSRGIIPLQKG